MGGSISTVFGKRPKVAVGGIFIECNDFGGRPADMSSFERMVLARGAAMLESETSAVGGMLQFLRESDAEIAPLLYAAAHPAGPITSETYRALKANLLDELRASLPVDGVLLPLHGSAAVEDDVDDVEGDLVSSVASLIGPDIPIVMTLDLHGSVTAEMIAHSTGILGCETYPHVDYFTTGRRAADLLLNVLSGNISPRMVMAKVPVIVGAVHTATNAEGPFAVMMKGAKGAEGRSSIVSTSAFLVHPHLDRPEMGSGVLVISDGSRTPGEALARRLAMEYWEHRDEIEPPLFKPDQGIARGLANTDRPVILVDAADCVGGGAAGDSVAVLNALLRLAPYESALVPVVDPAAAQACHLAGVGSTLTLSLGHMVDPKWGEPVTVTGVVERITDGNFRYDGGAFEADAMMGPSAVLAINQIRVLISTFGTYDWRDEQFRLVGLDPDSAKFVVVKNPMNHVMTYGDIAAEIIVLDTPGPTPPTCSALEYKRLARPFYPYDKEIPGFEPTILRN